VKEAPKCHKCSIRVMHILPQDHTTIDHRPVLAGHQGGTASHIAGERQLFANGSTEVVKIVVLNGNFYTYGFY